MIPSVSIVIPCRNEERYIARCLDSLLASTYPLDRLEIFVVDGMSDDATCSILDHYCTAHPFIHKLDNPDKTTPQALNIGIKASDSDYVIILSAHADYPADYGEKLVTEAQRLNAACTGPLLQTKTLNHHKTAQAIIHVLSDRLGVGSTFRTGADTVMEVDTVAFGCYRADALKQFGLFDERLIRNQDIELNKRIVRGGGKIYLIPDVVCTYYARDNFADFARNNYQNGFWNILTPYYTETFHSLSLRHFIPLLFVSALMFSALVGIFFSPILVLGAALFSLYFSLIALRSFQIKKETTWVHQITAFLVLHFSYGFGGIGGIIALFKKILFRES